MTIKLLGLIPHYDHQIVGLYHNMTIKLLGLIQHYDDQTAGLNTTL